MSQAFLQLSDFALYNGVLEGAPAFAFELRSTTEKILALARRGSEEDGDEDGQGEPAAASPGQDSSAGGNLQATSALDASVWGYTLKTTDAEMVDPATTTTTNTTIAMPPTTSTSYEELSFDDSPLPFGLTPATPQIDIDLPQQTFTTPNFFQPSLPNTLAHTEATFGRRLQRTALQWGYRLLSHPNPPPHDVTRAFGFCLLFEPADRIRARLRAGLAKLANENLHHWPSPFWALGGSGKQNHHNSYFPPPTTTSSSSSALSSSPPPVGNDGSRDVGKHSFGGDFGMGPFEENVMAAREEKIDPSMRITLPGWSGDFYDPDNVEAYLRSQGMVIRPGQDFATAEVEGGWFEEAEDEDQQQHQQQQKQQVVSSPDTIMSTSSSSSLASGAGGDEWGFETVGFDFGDEASWAALTGSEPVPNESQKKIVTIDVDVLIQGAFPLSSFDDRLNNMLTTFVLLLELVKRGQCLGRSPGYRLKDINHAFWIASRSDRILEF